MSTWAVPSDIMPARSRVRRPLRLDPRGQFVFTPSTVSIDVSSVFPGGGKRTLHVGRSKGAIEPAGGGAAWEVDAVSITAILAVLDAQAASTGAVSLSAVIPVATRKYLKRTARAIVSSPQFSPPFEGRPRRCYPAKEDDGTESLWIATDTLEVAVEIRMPAIDDRGRFVGLSHGAKTVSRKEAIEWLVANGYREIPVELIDRQ